MFTAVTEDHTNKTITVAEINIKEEFISWWIAINCLLKNISMYHKPSNTTHLPRVFNMKN